jgi:hypothetical protein
LSLQRIENYYWTVLQRPEVAEFECGIPVLPCALALQLFVRLAPVILHPSEVAGDIVASFSASLLYDENG